MASPTTALLDNANRANEGPPPTGWTTTGSGIKIVSNAFEAAVADGASNSAASWNIPYTAGAQEAWTTCVEAIASGGNRYYVLFCCQEVQGTYDELYEIEYDNNAGGRFRVYKVVAGVFTQLGSTFSTTMAANDQIWIHVLNGTVTGYLNGTARASGSTDGAITGTFIGQGFYVDVIAAASLDNFGGGSLPIQAVRSMHQIRMRQVAA